MKRTSIFRTWESSPIKNVKTPIRRFNGEDDEDTEITPVVTDPTQPETNSDDLYVALNQIKFMLFVLLIMKLICLIRK